jgi:hypothetical protein
MRLPLKKRLAVLLVGHIGEEDLLDEWCACECFKDGFFADKSQLITNQQVFEQGAVLKDLAEERSATLARWASASHVEL